MLVKPGMQVQEVKERDLRKCNRCGGRIVFMQGKSQKWYPAHVGVKHGPIGDKFVTHGQPHRCGK